MATPAAAAIASFFPTVIATPAAAAIATFVPCELVVL